MKLTMGLALALLGRGASEVRFSISPAEALMDDRVAIRVTGLPPQRAISIAARSRDQSHRWWRSAAVFLSRDDGSIDLSAQAPASGSYSGADAMGLFWSMLPEAPDGPFFTVTDWRRPVETELEAMDRGRVLASGRLVRRFAAPGVRAEPFRNNGLAGVLYRPAEGARKRRGVIVLGGSEGGLPEPEGAMLASRGFVALALAYFKADGLPPSMQKIPVEYFGTAIRALASLPEVEKTGVAVFGASRGAEAALIAGSIYPEVSAVAAVSASDVRWEGATARELPGGPAWTLEGKPLPFIPFRIGPGFAARYVWNSLTRRPVSLRPMFLDSLERRDTEEAHIPVERIRGPVLLASGRDDRKWPSALMSARAIARLRRCGHGYPDEHVSYEGAGHWLPAAYTPTTGLGGRIQGEIGGSAEATARVQAEWWPKVLRFLARGN